MNSAMRMARSHRKRGYRNEAVISALEALFRPLARVLVEQGVSSPEAESLLRSVCVHQVAAAQAAHGKRTNASRIAFVTGLHRKEVSRILRHPPRVNPAVEARCDRANRVLDGWYTDRAFVHNNRPLVLPVKAANHTGPSFWTLASRYAPDVYPGLVLRELSRVGALQTLRDGRVRPRTRRYTAKGRMPLPAKGLLRSSGVALSPRK